MKVLNHLIAFIFLFIMMVSCNKDNSTPKEGVEIGKQIWMEKNLNVDKFRNGDLIPQAQTEAEWRHAWDNQQPVWCYYNNDPVNGELYGKLYNWFAIKDHRGLALKGWHIPSDLEWAQLADFLGGREIAGTKMKSTTGWSNNNNGTNESGFNALPGGRNAGIFFFVHIGDEAWWWSSDEDEWGHVWSPQLILNALNHTTSYKDVGLSVRCISD